jgi:beta-lactamase superfamily II metal-dependent hydrolase
MRVGEKIIVSDAGEYNLDKVSAALDALDAQRIDVAILSRAVMKAIKDEGLEPTYVHAGQSFDWGGAEWQILNPVEGQFTGGKHDAANSSVAYLLTVNGE